MPGAENYAGATDRTAPRGAHRVAAGGGAGGDDGLLSTASLRWALLRPTAAATTSCSPGSPPLSSARCRWLRAQYVSVHSQKDTEDTDLALERAELRTNDKGEHEELAEIYADRGVGHTLAKKVADQLLTHDALGAHARDELGITPGLEARPIQAALATAARFILGAGMPLIVAALVPSESALRRPGGVAPCAGGSRSVGGAEGRRAHGARRVAGHVLGRARDGRHCRRRRFVRHDCLISIRCQIVEPAVVGSELRVKGSSRRPVTSLEATDPGPQGSTWL